ncbi:hypothetical protein RND81_04G179900 [Saponaria officinalis]|uniref:Retrotransposon gag domain-containing protein n=1 Tax=Saponaria officinalis TaxID=3572 RepID=A0AAW1LN29_SAPOF
MSNIANLEFGALDITGKNYLSWVLDAEIHLDAKGLGDPIKVGNKATSQDKAKSMIFLRHHLHEGLKNEYLTVKDPQTLWSDLKERYDHQKTVILPKAHYEWLHLRLQDFKSVSEYNSAMFKITSQLKLCGENISDANMLEKTYSTFHANNLVLQTQYREKGFNKYSQLISCLLVAEQNNELLMKNHESRPTGSTPFPEANVTLCNKREPKNKDYASSSSRGHGRGFGGFGGIRGSPFKKTQSYQKWDHKDRKNEGKNENMTSVCYRYGRKGHWSRVCRTPKHLIDLYQQSLKQKGKNIETNLVFEDEKSDFDLGDLINIDDFDPADPAHLDVADFIISPKGNI